MQQLNTVLYNLRVLIFNFQKYRAVKDKIIAEND